MSKMGNDFFDMQEDAMTMTKEDFIKKYGTVNADLYEQINNNNEPDPEFLTEGQYGICCRINLLLVYLMDDGKK